jgi:predicted MPP superfamily phosphohydrolase
MNFHVLENEIKMMGANDTQWQLAGVDWDSDFDKTFLSKKAELPLITLMHQPRGVEEVIDKHKSDLQLSGHTHGGQIWPFSYLVGLVQPYVSGLHQHGDGHIYVSNGTGFWGSAIRIGAPAEITEIILKS